MSTVIAFHLPHHGNTKQLVDAIESEAIVDVAKYKGIDLSKNDVIGFAYWVCSGSFFQSDS